MQEEGVENGLSLNSSVSVVLTGLGRSEGEETTSGGDLTGDRINEVGTGAASGFSQVVEETSWTEVVRRNMRSKGTTEMSSMVGRMGEEGYGTKGGFEPREGDWNCKTRSCEGYMNFKRRSHCRKCGRDRNGERLPTQEQQGGEQRERSLSPGERLRMRLELYKFYNEILTVANLSSNPKDSQFNYDFCNMKCI